MLNNLSHALGFAGDALLLAGLAIGVGVWCLSGDCDAFLEGVAEDTGL